MSFHKALFYPWIDIEDEAWLKSAFLYWDSIQTIVPESVTEPYKSNVAKTLSEDLGFLAPLRVSPDMKIIEDLSEDVLNFLFENPNEVIELFNPSTKIYLHPNKLSPKLQKLVNLHPEKLSESLQYEIENIFGKREFNSLKVAESFADLYMTLLATRLADENTLGLLTPSRQANEVSWKSRLNVRFDELFSNHFLRDPYLWHRFHHKRGQLPLEMVEGTFAQIAIEKILIDPNTNINSIIQFKKSRKDELSRFRIAMNSLSLRVDQQGSLRDVRNQIQELSKEIDTSVYELKKALNGDRITYFTEGLIFLTSISTFVHEFSGLSAPFSLLAATGMSYVISKVRYNVEREKVLANSEYSYLFEARDEFAH